MSEFMILAIVFISMLVLFYFLWVNGYMILNAKRALLFVGSLRGKNKCEVSFSSCSGYVKKVIKFNESREYTFKLDGDVSKGSIHVIIENKNKETMANNIAFDKLNTPEWGLVVAGVIISAIGMLMGSLLKKKRCK